ncbi:alpha/beta hydrolase [Allopontixanthobacter sp.]|uniref:alpha/beta fold hydrolase n=1 Tax=Allopontixanthobacter sp. TaxID=2906452 RepID=UPI002ABA1DBF|nr:alpha/beta hydrolase [Allopontixanthobacter sp.]MDZ4308101.1 alpha/beta hydrolase [Allopontixanthobacter sp.]
MKHALMVSALLTLGCSPISPLAAAPQPAAISVGEVRMDHISIVEMGAGDPVILIPGLSTPRGVWEGVAAELAKSHRVLLVQVNGFGGDDPGGNLREGILEGAVSDIVAFMRQKKIEKPAVIGHSMGGVLSLMIASRHKDALGRVMVVDALPYLGVQLAPPGTDITVAQVMPTARQMRDTVAAAYGMVPDAEAAAQNVKGMAIKETSRKKMQAWAMAADARVAGQVVFEILTTDLRPEMIEINAPVTVIYPWSSQGLPKERLDAFYRRQFAEVGQTQYVALPDAGHFVMLDQPELFQEQVMQFLDRRH